MAHGGATGGETIRRFTEEDMSDAICSKHGNIQTTKRHYIAPEHRNDSRGGPCARRKPQRIR